MLKTCTRCHSRRAKLLLTVQPTTLIRLTCNQCYARLPSCLNCHKSSQPVRTMMKYSRRIYREVDSRVSTTKSMSSQHLFPCTNRMPRGVYVCRLIRTLRAYHLRIDQRRAPYFQHQRDRGFPGVIDSAAIRPSLICASALSL